MTANVYALVLRSEYHGDGVPAQYLFDFLFEFDVAGVSGLIIWRNRISIRRI